MINSAHAYTARFHQSRDREEIEEKADGIEAGQYWARHQAGHGDLKRLLTKWNQSKNQLANLEEDAFAGAVFAMIGDQDHPFDRHAAERFWAAISGSSSPGRSFIAGFIEGTETTYNRTEFSLAK